MSKPKAKKGTPRKGAVKHSAQTIARTIALLYLGHTVEQVVKQTKLPKQTISTWRKYLPDDLGQPRIKKEVIEDLFAQYLEQGLKALLAQIEVISDPKWIKRQSADSLATLHGVLFDKLARVFDAARRGAELREQQAGLLPAAGTDATPKALS